MKKMKLKGFVLPTIYLLITISIFTGIIFLGQANNLKESDYNYSTNIIDSKVESVIVEDTVASSYIVSPVEEGKASITVHYYSKDDTEELQQNSLIYYENTYLPNTGVVYSSEEEFMVTPVFEGRVADILDDDFFGKCVVIEHANNLRTYYYGITDIKVTINDEVKTDTILGVSQNNEIRNSEKSFLLEIYYNNKLMNPEKVIGTKISDYN